MTPTVALAPASDAGMTCRMMMSFSPRAALYRPVFRRAAIHRRGAVPVQAGADDAFFQIKRG